MADHKIYDDCSICGQRTTVFMHHADTFTGGTVHSLRVSCPNGPHDVGDQVPEAPCPECGQRVQGRQV
jgi:endogenous inhibitor of DNA gyrase (YacG/DUF329 family)